LTYLKSYKPIYVDLGIWKFSTPNIEKHEHKRYPQERAPKNGDRRKYLESKRKIMPKLAEGLIAFYTFNQQEDVCKNKFI